MSGTLHIVKNKKTLVTNLVLSITIFTQKHNHVEIIFKNLKVIYND